jgi:hypothetical protein
MDAKYTRYCRFIRSTVSDAGFTKRSGDPNITAFWEAHKHVLKGKGFKMGPTNFRSQARGEGHNPSGETMEAMALILSSARRENVTVAMLHDLIDRPQLDKFSELEDAELPDDDAVAIVRAQDLLSKLSDLPLNARATIAPKILRLLAGDWEYLDSPEHIKISKTLNAELTRRGMGIEVFASKVMGGIITVDILKDIAQNRMPSVALNPAQIVALQKNLRSIDGDRLDPAELECLSEICP